MSNLTTIQLSKKTRNKLKELGRKGQSFDDIINEFLKNEEREKKWEKEIDKIVEFKENKKGERILTTDSIIKEIELMIRKKYGKKCTDYDEGCVLCRTWKVWEQLKKGIKK